MTMTMTTTSVALMAVAVVIISPAAVESMQFEVPSGSHKCIMEDIKSEAMAIGKYSIVNPDPTRPLPESHKVTVRVTSSKGSSYYTAESVAFGTFAFTAYEGGDYTACFWSSPHKASHVLTIDLDWKSGITAKDWGKVATKGKVEAMELELMHMYDKVIMIHDEMFLLREREEEMQALNRATNSKMATFSFLSILVSVSVAGLQLWHLKTFFERKKLL